MAGKTMKKRGGFYSPDAVRHQNKLPKVKRGGMSCGTKKAKKGGMGKMIDSIKKMLGGSSKRGARSKTHPGRKDYTTKKGDKDFHHKMKGHREEKMKGRTPYHKRK